jgi:H+/Na+-translocating ferredoxin:NAD+ oxidoreductase subunit B
MISRKNSRNWLKENDEMNTLNEHVFYKQLAQQLDCLPNGFPPTEDGIELKLLAKIFSPEEAALASQLLMKLETADEIASRLGREFQPTRQLLKSMARRGMIKTGKAESGLGYGLLPFVVGIYENQIGNLDKELAILFEEYYKRSFTKVLGVQPSFHRVVPVGESIKMNMQVAPYESAAGIIEQAQSWGVQDCICRIQTALVGKPCNHPVDVCMVFSSEPDAFAGATEMKALTKEEAYGVLRRSDEAGLVHCVSNNLKGNWYICNCCTCSCGILRGMAELGIANVVASSAFVNTVDGDLCTGCGLCVDSCQFGALGVDGVAIVNETKCVGCGVCVNSCADKALILVRRPEEQIKPVPSSMGDWGRQRAKARGIDLSPLL